MADDKVALVLAGGGARGAYEAGALTVLLPELERRGQRPAIAVGTSVGAVNAAFVAATAHLPSEQVVASAIAIWSRLDHGQVLAPLVSPGAAGRLAGYIAQVLGVPQARAWSVLDPSPLRRTLAEQIDFERLRHNVETRVIHAAAVVATSARTGRSVVFHQGGAPPSPHDDRRGIDYARTRLGCEHVLASAAIPALFPAVEIGRAWYADGGTRLNTPVKPALALGADRVVVVALNSLAAGDFTGRPDALAGAGGILRSLLADQLLHDVRTLQTVNELVRDAGRALAGRRAIPHVLITPERPDTVGAIARQVFREHYGRLRGVLRDRDVVALGRAVDGDEDAAHGELLSYLFFAPEFARALLDLGRRDARRWLDAEHDDGLWALSG